MNLPASGGSCAIKAEIKQFQNWAECLERSISEEFFLRFDR
jgi:hypothetical protein